MKEVLLNQVLPKIEKIISPYCASVGGHAALREYYKIIPDRLTDLSAGEKKGN